MSCGFHAKIKTAASVHSLIRMLSKLRVPYGEPRLDFEFTWFWDVLLVFFFFFLREACMRKYV